MSSMNVDSFKSELDEFASALEYGRVGIQQDTILETYQSIASEKAKLAFDNDESAFEDSELEARLWQLVKSLYEYRFGGKPPKIDVKEFHSDAVLQEEYLRENPKSRELWIIVQWLRDSMLSSEEPADLRGTKWMYTKNEIKKMRLAKFSQPGVRQQHTNAPRRSSVLAPRPEEELVTKLDSDAPIREKRGLSKDDVDFDRQLFKYIFELLMASQTEEAMNVCDRTSNWTLKLAIRGVNGFVDPQVDAPVLGIEEDGYKGIEHQPLWRRMCFELARQPHIDQYERGIYGILSNDLSSVLELCDTWESQLLAYLSHMLAEDSEKPLIMTNRIDSKLRQLDVPHTRLSTVSNALDVLAHSTNPVVKQQSDNLLRNLVGAIINDTVDVIVDQLAVELDRLMSEGDDNASLATTPYIIRVTTHLILYLQSHGTKCGSSSSIAIVVRAYIQILCHEDKSHLVPLYVSYLPADLANETYSFLLANITDIEERKRHLELGKKYKLDMDHMVRMAVHRVFEESPELYQTLSIGQLVLEVDPSDVRLYKAVEWYINAGLYGDAVHSSVHLFRRFLNSGRVKSAKEFGLRVPLGTILKKYDALAATNSSIAQISDNQRTELMEYDRFINCLHDIANWNEHYEAMASKLDHVPTNRDVTRTWAAEALNRVGVVSQSVYDLCDNWMVGLVDSDPTIAKIRATFIPHLLLELAKILIEAQAAHPRFLKQAVELANLVADEDTQLYQYFVQGGALEAFIKRIAEAFTDGIADGEKGIYD